jgi:thiosulfate dehydrogenase [quinone] large subunit
MTEQAAGVRGLAQRFALLPLRIFMGITFIYAGLDKLTDAHYLAGLGDPLSFAATTQSIKGGSPIEPLLNIALKAPTGFALAIAIGELAVGLGILTGLFGRVAALGGILLNLSFFLTVSWQVYPYYLGNDLIYLMAWLPLLLAGTPYLSLDGLLRSRLKLRPAQGSGEPLGRSSSSPMASRSGDRSS